MIFTQAIIAILMSLGFLNSPADLDTMTTAELEALEIIVETDIHGMHNDDE